MRNSRIAMAIAAALALLSACAAAPKDHFYTLDAVPPAVAVASHAPRYRIALGPVHVPEIVDRPEMVVRQGPNRVKVLETHRWAQSLKNGIAHALAADLDARLGDAQVAPAGDYASRNADYRIAIDIERFDAMPGDSVSVEAAWTIFGASAEKPVKAGRAAVKAPVVGRGYEAIAAAYGQALATISEEMEVDARSLGDSSGR